MLIIGGNIRLLPLTGVTLPFVSYGGSSLLTAYRFISIINIDQPECECQSQYRPRILPFIQDSELYCWLAYSVAALVIGWWTYVRGP